MPCAVLRIIAFCVAFCVGCGGRTDTEGSSRGGSGGAAGAGGMGAGGAIGSGGTIGAAGVMSSGGTTGLAGTTASGGASGASGAGESGGNGGAAAGGMSGAGGSIGGAGGRGGGSGGRGGTTGFAGRGGASGGGGGSGGAGTAGSDGGAGGVGGAPMMSAGCGKTPTLKNSPSASTFTYNTISSGGTQRQYILRWPTDYDSTHPYRLIIGLHGATGKGSDVARSPAYFGLFDLSQGSTIFIAPDAAGGLWSAAPDTTFVDDILEKVEADLCIDLTRIELEGFSQGAAMAWTLACSRPGVFRAVVGHSGGGVANPTSCQPIAYMGSLGLQENGGQNTQTDQFAKFNACTITTLPRAPSGGHVCTDYTGCPTARPVRWCSYDGGHTPSPTDSGQSTSWMPREVWSFLTRF